MELLEKLSDIKLKVVKRAGDKVIDLLHQSNSWADSDCFREDCIVCKTANSNEKKGKCRKRNVLYEIICISCYKKDLMEKGIMALEKTTSEKNDTIVVIEHEKHEETNRIGKRKREKEKKYGRRYRVQG